MCSCNAMGVCNTITNLFLSVLLLVFVLLPIHLYRILISILAKCAITNVSHIVDLRSAVETPSNCTLSNVGNVVVTCVFNNLNIAKLIDAVNRFSDSDPKLKCYVETRLGFDFWIKDEAFDIDNHLVYLENLRDGKFRLEGLSKYGMNDTTNSETNRIMGIRDLDTVKKFLLQDIQPKKQSLWKFCVVNNIQSQDGTMNSALLLKFYHGLGDGFGTLLSLLGCAGLDDIPILSGSYDVPMTTKIWLWILAVGNLKETIFRPKILQPSEFLNRPKEELTGVANCRLGRSEPLELRRMKMIKNHFKVPFAVISLYGVTTALRKFCQKKQAAVPPSLLCFYLMPVPRHPGKLTNHWTFAFLELPTGEDDNLERIRKLHEIFKDAHKQGAINLNLSKLLGGVFRSWMPEWDDMTCPMAISDFPGPLSPVHALDGEIIDIDFHANYLTGRQGTLFRSLSYAGSWTSSTMVDGEIATGEEDGDNLAAHVTTSIVELEKLIL